MRSSTWLFAVVALLLLGGAGRLAYLQHTRGEALRARAERQQTAQLRIPALRGDILDARGRVLAGTVRRPSVYVDPTAVEDPRFAAHSVAQVLEGVEARMLEEEILERLSWSGKGRQFAWVKRGISEGELAAFEEICDERGLRGFGIRWEAERVYPYGRTASHVIGFLGGTDDPNLPGEVGLAGIEQRWDTVLRGTEGRRRAIVDRLRRVRAREDEYIAPRDGSSIVLTIDVRIQQIAEERLRKVVSDSEEGFDADWATAVVMDPQTGEILAMASYPDFDPANPLPGDLRPGSAEEQEARARLRNRAIADSYEPGSIYKPFICCSAFDAGLVHLDQPFAINGPTHFFGRRRISDTHAYSTLEVREIISKSSNIGMGMIGDISGNERLYRWVRRLGFGDYTGVQLPGEHMGQVNDFERWTGYSTQSIPIGQEVGVTPLQIVTAFSTFGNGGILYRPRIVRGVVAADGEIEADFSEPIPLRRVFSAEKVEEFRQRALGEVVRSGTARHLKFAGYELFGKTGTAQISLPGERGYASGAYMASFVCGAPLDEPRVVVLVSVCRPKQRSYYGGQVAGPVAAGILVETLEYLQVPHDPPPERAARR